MTYNVFSTTLNPTQSLQTGCPHGCSHCPDLGIFKTLTKQGPTNLWASHLSFDLDICYDGSPSLWLGQVRGHRRKNVHLWLKVRVKLGKTSFLNVEEKQTWMGNWNK